MKLFGGAAFLLLSATFCFGQDPEARVVEHAHLAQEAEARRDFATAIREYRLISAWRPQSAEAQSNLGVALYFGKETARALSVLQKAERLNPSLPVPHLFSGLAWYRLAKPDRAVQELEIAVKLNGSDRLARSYRGYAYFDEQRYDAALNQLEPIFRTDASDIDVAYVLGNCYLEKGRAATRKLLAVAPDGARVQQLAAEQFELRDEKQKALALFMTALAKRPDLPDLREAVLKLGGTPGAPSADVPASAGAREEDELYNLAHGDEIHAHAAFEQITQQAPDSYRAHQVLADSFAAQGRLEEAIAEYRQVLERKPDLPGIHQEIAEALLGVAQVASAREEFQAELNARPGSPQAQIGLAQTWLLTEDARLAETILKAALQQQQPPSEAYKLQAKINLRRHDYPGAIAMLTRYCGQVKHDASAYYSLTQAYRALGNTNAMRDAEASYQRLSQGAKERTSAQKALDRFDKTKDMETLPEQETASKLP